MFPTFDVPPQHSETVGARRERKARERRASTSTKSSEGSASRSIVNHPPPSSHSSGSSKSKPTKAFGGFFKSKSRDVTEITDAPPPILPKPLHVPTEPIVLSQAQSPVSSTPKQELYSPVLPEDLPPVLRDKTLEDVRQARRADAFDDARLQHRDRPPLEQPRAPQRHHLAPFEDPKPLRRQSPIEYGGQTRRDPLADHLQALRRDRAEELRPPLSPPSRNLPPVPLPPPPPPAPARIVEPRRHVDRAKSSYSVNSVGTSTTTTSSAVSSGSIFSTPSQYDDLQSDISDFEPNPPPPILENSQRSRSASAHRPGSRSQYASKFQLEPVTESRSQSRAALDAAPAQTPFARALAKMDNAGPRIIATRLSEEWEGLDDDESYQEVVFEKRLWALTAYQRLTLGKHLQSPVHELLTQSRPADGRRILNLHGSLADGWMLASHYPASTVYTISSKNTSSSPTAYPAPLNHHTLYVPSISSSMPFPDSYFDAIVSRSISTSLRNDEWARTFFDCMRVLKPGGQIEVLSLDPHLSRQGQQLTAWVDEHVSQRLEAHSMSMMPSDTVLDTMEIVGLQNIRRARIALPAQPPNPKALKAAAEAPGASPADAKDATQLMVFLGRHLYQDLYGKFVRQQEGEAWFWSEKDMRVECERLHTKMVLTIACAQKPATVANSESYLDI